MMMTTTTVNLARVVMVMITTTVQASQAKAHTAQASLANRALIGRRDSDGFVNIPTVLFDTVEFCMDEL